MKVCIDSDKDGLLLKREIVTLCRNAGYNVTDLRGHLAGEWPDIGYTLAKKIAAKEYERGILICKTGLGMAIVANKVRGVYAGRCHDVTSAVELAASKNAQILVLGADFISIGSAKKVVSAFLVTEFTFRPNAERMHELEAIG